jgi:hypothetical protein
MWFAWITDNTRLVEQDGIGSGVNDVTVAAVLYIIT